MNNLMEDLKLLYRVAGAAGKGITFVFTDNEIKDEAFLEFINNVLSSGEVANLFAKDEIDEIQQNLVPVMKKEMPKRPPTSENLYDYFLTRAKNNLHVVLCFSPVSYSWRQKRSKKPSVPPPQRAPYALAFVFLSTVSLMINVGCVKVVKVVDARND